MPPAVTAQNDYYARHHRRQSSQSQTSLPDQLRKPTTPVPYSPNRSDAFLPATTYIETSAPRPRTPSESYDRSRLDTSLSQAQVNDSRGGHHSTDPDDYYRQYQDPFAQSSVGSPSLHQAALRTTGFEDHSQRGKSRKGSQASTWSTEERGSHSQRESTNSAHLPGLRAKKASVKNLVAQFNATSSDETPPLPPQKSFVIHDSRNISPIVPAAPPFFPTAGHRHPSTANYSYHFHPALGLSEPLADHRSGSRPSNHSPDSATNDERQPLFGEILSSSTATPIPGYGITDTRRRSGSEGSSMRHPNPMFPPEDSETQNLTLLPAVYTETLSTQNGRRRANSDLSSAIPSKTSNDTHHGDAAGPTTSNRKASASSRIPVSAARSHPTSDSGDSSSAPPSTSALDKRRPTSRSRLHIEDQPPVSNLNAAPKMQQQAGKPTTPAGRRGKSTAPQQGDKSPSLRANIIAPPPKISPPLRSSRPRQPVSNASTAASRARIAEKVHTMNKKLNNKQPGSGRPRPPELTDVDLKARRMRITQALSKSREGLGQQAETSNVKQPEEESGSVDSTLSTRGTVPTLRVDSVESPVDATAENNGNGLRQPTQSGLHVTQNSLQYEDKEEESPTLGIAAHTLGSKLAPIDTDLSSDAGRFGPSSARTDATNETEATIIDPEPQTDDPNPRPLDSTLLNHVMQLRDNSPRSTFTPSPNINENASERGDVESVHLIMRDTTYLDEDEALQKGYRTNFAPPARLPEENEKPNSDRDSWTSALDDNEYQRGSKENEGLAQDQSSASPTIDNQTLRSGGTYFPYSETVRDTMESDAYTIVNIVLQQHAESGIVDQQFVDDVYNRVLQQSPYFEDDGTIDTERVEKFCLQEIQQRDENDRRSVAPNTSKSLQQSEKEVNTSAPHLSQISATENEFMPLPPPKFRGHHRHKSSLDSAEDWAMTSPSVGDWMRFAHDNDDSSDESIHGLKTNELESNEFEDDLATPTTGVRGSIQNKESVDIVYNEGDSGDLHSEEFGTAIIRAPSQSPPPPPKDYPTIGQTLMSGSANRARSPLPPPKEVPYRVGSLGQTALNPQTDPSPPDNQDSSRDSTEAEARRLKRRKHVLKELVDTEFSYERDMRVLCDIYMQTALAALGDDDIRTLFGNVEQIQNFSKDFLAILKRAAKPAYTMERSEVRSEEAPNGMARANSNSSTLTSNQLVDPNAPDSQGDRGTRIGSAFENSLADMEKVYTEYIRNRHAANQKLESLQRLASVQEWLKECRENSSDITNAWNLDALLVKPVQRITKYPLLLKELIDATTDDHPDMPALRRSFGNVTEINIRINDVKKHAELVDQVLNRKRGQSDVRTGLSKAFGRRAEKLKQHVGIAEMYEDGDYNEIRISYDNNIVQLMVVANDCISYEKGMHQWVSRMVNIAAAAEAWVDVGHSHHPQAESKLRQLSMIIRGISTIALPDHLEHLQKKVFQPMQKTIDLLTKFKEDPKGLLHKRDKRLVDYAQMRNKKDRGEKVDRKMAERMDQWEALNTEAKERMKRLLRATAHLVQSCQGNLVRLQMSWMVMLQQKFSNAMGLQLIRLELQDIEKDWQEDFDFQEATALGLGLCNGSLLLEAANMVSFLTPGTTLNGDDSPREQSWNSTNKRSISLNSEASNVPTLDMGSRPSTTFAESHFDRPYPFGNGRIRATSVASGKSGRTSEPSLLPSTTTKHSSSGSGQPGRPGTSSGLPQENITALPRLSLDATSPFLGSTPTPPMPDRPPSSSTFFSASAAPSLSRAGHQSTTSSIFSSALPMTDSPQQENPSVDIPSSVPEVLFTAASVYEFNIDRARREAGFPYLTYVTGEIFDVIGERGELWLARNQDDPQKQIGWIWNKHFAKLAT